MKLRQPTKCINKAGYIIAAALLMSSTILCIAPSYATPYGGQKCGNYPYFDKSVRIKHPRECGDLKSQIDCDKGFRDSRVSFDYCWKANGKKEKNLYVLCAWTGNSCVPGGTLYRD